MSNITNQYVYDLDREHVFHSWSVQGKLNPLVIESGRGTKMWDFEGKEYLDFSSQLVNTNIGHQHPKVIEKLKEQADILMTVAPSTANLARGEAAEAILRHAPSNFKKVFFTNAGADANENAIRIARAYTGRDKILSAYRSYHGNTGSAIAATGDYRRVPNEFSRGHARFFNPYLYRSEFWATTEEEECERALHHLRRVIEAEGAAGIAAILLESVPGTAGVIVPPKGYMEGVRKLCDEFGILMIMDEVMAGFGRLGTWFAFEDYDLTPDLITFAKGVNSGYVPAGGVIIPEHITKYYDDKMFFGGMTYSGHPLAMSTITATINVMEEERVVENAAEVGNGVLAKGLKELADKYPIVGDLRGRAVFWALELVSDRESKALLSTEAMNSIKADLLERGLLPFIADNRIHVAPPCNVSEEEVKQALKIYDAVLATAQEKYYK